MSPIILAAKVGEMKQLNADGIAARLKPTSLEYICTTVAPTLPADADYEHIHLALLRAAMKYPAHFEQDFLDD